MQKEGRMREKEKQEMEFTLLKSKQPIMKSTCFNALAAQDKAVAVRGKCGPYPHNSINLLVN